MLKCLGCDAPKNAGISKIVVSWALEHRVCSAVLEHRVCSAVLGARKAAKRGLHRDCATLQNHHSTSEPHNNRSNRTSSQPRASKITSRNYVFVKIVPQKLFFVIYYVKFS